MLACLCPLKAAAEESLNTLHFASMALRIKATPVITLDPQVGDSPLGHALLKPKQAACSKHVRVAHNWQPPALQLWTACRLVHWSVLLTSSNRTQGGSHQPEQALSD